MNTYLRGMTRACAYDSNPLLSYGREPKNSFSPRKNWPADRD
jgi:hypothetical protein